MGYYITKGRMKLIRWKFVEFVQKFYPQITLSEVVAGCCALASVMAAGTSTWVMTPEVFEVYSHFNITSTITL